MKGIPPTQKIIRVNMRIREGLRWNAKRLRALQNCTNVVVGYSPFAVAPYVTVGHRNKENPETNNSVQSGYVNGMNH